VNAQYRPQLPLKGSNVDLANSALKKNEDLLDTMHTLQAMQIDMFVVRHKQSGLPHYVAENLNNITILNAGDGVNAHPTQALLDMLTIRQHKQSFENLSVAIAVDHFVCGEQQTYQFAWLGACAWYQANLHFS
jgi:aspartate carbamoyltransferase catalytic subunit